MADNKNIDKDLEISEEEALFITLTDEDGSEIEFEVIRDSRGNSITVCSMENVDPVGSAVVVDNTLSIAGAAVNKPVPTVAMIFPAISHFDTVAAATAKLVNNINVTS